MFLFENGICHKEQTLGPITWKSTAQKAKRVLRAPYFLSARHTSRDLLHL